MARKEGKKAKGAGARALASVAVTLRVTTTPAALNAPLQGASHSPFRLQISVDIQSITNINNEEMTEKFSFCDREKVAEDDGLSHGVGRMFD